MPSGNLWQAFASVVDAYPDNEAFSSPDTVFTYRRLAVAASELADRLSARHVGAGDLVAIESPVGPELVVGMLAAVAVGAAYLPINTTSPAKRRAAILAHARPKVVLGGDDLRQASAHSAAIAAALDPARHTPATGAYDPAYVIYTSGSTGTPKGVVVSARGVHNLLAAFQSRAPVGPGARHSWWTSPEFDVSVYEIWSALCGGGSIVPVPEAHRRDVDATLDYLADQEIESAYLPPQFLPALRDRIRHRGPVPPLRRLLTGVEPIPVGLLVELRSSLPGAVVINGYGPTETTVCATLYTVPEHCTQPQRRAPIGSVIEGNRGFVLDERLSAVEPGRPGELFVAGAGVALGYLHDQQLTAKRFLPATNGDGMMYRTGDVVVSDPDGELTFLGRVDDQLKIDGVRIEPAETEAVLRRMPEIADVTVLAWPATPGGPSVLTAFIVPAAANAGRGLLAELRERLAEELPAPAVPRRMWTVDRIPMTLDGKLDRAALPQPTDQPARPARDDHEQAVMDACRAVLPHTPAGLLDLSFAELGGDSLRAAQLSAALRARTGRIVTAARMLAAPTMADLSAELATLPIAADAADAEEEELGSAPLTPGQLGIWAAELTGASAGAFHETVAVELTGAVDPPRIAQELTTVLNRHIVFRGRIDEDSLRLVTDAEPVRVTTRSVTSGESFTEVWQSLLIAVQRPAFDLDRGPLVRAAVLAGLNVARVVVVWHHLVVDAWSARIVLEELAAALTGRGRPTPVDRAYADYARQQRHFLDSREGKQAVIAAAERVRAWLPEPGPTPAAARDACQLQNLAVGPQVWSRVRQCARRTGTTMFTVVLAAIHGPLCRLAESRSRFALAVADRNNIYDTSATGYFLTTIPFGPSNDIDRNASMALRYARDVIREAQALARVPFPSLMAELGIRDAQSLAPLVIAWDRDVVTELSIPGCEVRSLPVPPLGARWPWTVILTDCGQRGMAGRIEFPLSVLADRVAGFAMRVEPLLDEFVSSELEFRARRRHVPSQRPSQDPQ